MHLWIQGINLSMMYIFFFFRFMQTWTAVVYLYFIRHFVRVRVQRLRKGATRDDVIILHDQKENMYTSVGVT